jgi:hypothetical protein
LTLVLALRLATPTGFMPIFERGQFAVVPCDGSEPAAAPRMAHHHHHDGKTNHQPCPYGAASSPALLPTDGFSAIKPLPLAAVAVAAFAVLRIARGRHDRPPATGPPFPA